PQLLAAAIATGSRTNQMLRSGSSFGEKAPRDSGHRSTPTKSARPVAAPAARVAGSCRPSGTRPRLTTTSPPDATWAGANNQQPRPDTARRKAEPLVDERFRTRHERGRDFHATKFVVCRRKARPALARRQIARGRGKALFEGPDQRFLPGLALELPSAERDEDCGRHQREHGWHRQAGWQPPCQRNIHGASPPVKRPSAALW